MTKTLQEFRDYIYKISKVKGLGIDTYWLQSLVSSNIQTESEAIEYLFHHQDLVEKYIQNQKGL